MRRTLVMVCVACLAGTPATAGSLLVGVQGGTSIPNLRDRGGNEISSGWATRVAPDAGVFLNYGLTDAFSLQTEVSYVAQGGKRDGMQPAPVDPTQFGAPPGTLLYANFKNVAKLDYLEIPLLGVFSVGKERKFSAAFGPYMGILLSAKTVSSGTSPIFLDKSGTQPAAPAQNFDATTDNKADLNTFNWGLQGGVSVAQPVGRGRVSLSVRAGLGLANIQKDTAANGKNGTGNVAITLGYGLPVNAR